MSLFATYKDEADFREKLVKPLLNRLGYLDVTLQHGTQEFGKDFVFSELHRLGGMRHYAAQVKHEATIHQGRSIDVLLTQVRQAFSKPFRRADSPALCRVSAVYVFNSGGITANAKEQLLSELDLDRYGSNVHFLDGERLQYLNEFATLQDDTTVRRRLIGLRGSLMLIVGVLESFLRQEQPNTQPIFFQSVEQYLSEPVHPNHRFNVLMLLSVWRQLREVDRLRNELVARAGDSAFFAATMPQLLERSTHALVVVNEGLEMIDSALKVISPNWVDSYW